jgi:hypothetical protein
MTVKTISTTYNYGYELRAPTTVLSITSTGFISGQGLTAEGAGTYTIVNMGTIYSSLHPPESNIGNKSGASPKAPSINRDGYTGIYLQGGASITNGSVTNTAATIYGESAGLIILGAGTVANFGTISTKSGYNHIGVMLGHGGEIVNGAANDTSALIYGSIRLNGGTNLLENFGTLNTGISGVSLSGGTVINGSSSDLGAQVESSIYFSDRGTLTNFGTVALEVDLQSPSVEMWAASGNVVTNGSAADRGAYLAGQVEIGGGVVTNFGTIATDRYDGYAVWGEAPGGGAAGALTVTNLGTIISRFDLGEEPGNGGLRLTGGGEVTNGSSGNHSALISGEVGLVAMGAATVTNFGVITGRYGDAVVFSSAADRFIAEAGSKTNGVVIGDRGTLELATGTGTISGLGATATISGSVAMTATGFGVYALDAGASWVLSGADTLAAGDTLLNSGTLTSSGSLTLAGKIVNTGDLVIAGGTVRVEDSLAVGGVFSESAGATIDVAAGARLTLTGPALLAGAINGPGIVSVGGASIDALTLNGATLVARRTVSQSGTVTLGDTGSGLATIDILKAGEWEIGSGSIVKGAGRGVLRDFGLLIKDSGTGVSEVGVTTYDDGTIEVATGTLDFTQRLYGTGALKIDAGATLEADRSAAAALTISFAGAGATLAMRFARTFAATISGFAAGDTLDLLKTRATGASVNGNDQLVIVNGNTIVATLQLSGSYAGTSFIVDSDGRGGSDITIANGANEQAQIPQSPTPQLLAAAMAAMGAPAGGAVAAHTPLTIHAPMLLRPHAPLA